MREIVFFFSLREDIFERAEGVLVAGGVFFQMVTGEENREKKKARRVRRRRGVFEIHR